MKKVSRKCEKHGVEGEVLNLAEMEGYGRILCT
jgi:hypothetical protein